LNYPSIKQQGFIADGKLYITSNYYLLNIKTYYSQIKHRNRCSFVFCFVNKLLHLWWWKQKFGLGKCKLYWYIDSGAHKIWCWRVDVKKRNKRHVIISLNLCFMFLLYTLSIYIIQASTLCCNNIWTKSCIYFQEY